MNRLKRVTAARIDSFLSTVEDPEIILPQLIEEMLGAVMQAKNAEVTALAAVKSARRKVDEADGTLMRLDRGASLALQHNDEKTARDALAEQLSVEKLREELLKPLKGALAAVETARSVRAQLEGELVQLRAKKSEIVARSRTVAIRKTIGCQQTGGMASILDQVSRLEAQLEEDEAALDVRATGRAGGESLEERLERLEWKSEVEIRMNALRAKTSKEDT